MYLVSQLSKPPFGTYCANALTKKANSKMARVNSFDFIVVVFWFSLNEIYKEIGSYENDLSNKRRIGS